MEVLKSSFDFEGEKYYLEFLPFAQKYPSLIPKSTREIEYVAYVTRYYSFTGDTYSSGTKAARRNEQLAVVRYPDAKPVTIIGTVQGGNPESYFSYTGDPPAMKLGDSPNNEDVLSLIEQAMQYIEG